MRELVTYPDRDMMLLDLADKLAAELSDHLRRTGRASLCVPGGRTPGPIFDVLSEQALDWSQVAVFLNDERWVAESSPRSNTRLLKEKLLVSRAAAARYLPLKGPSPAPEADLHDLAAALEPHLPISVLLLGMGADMHTASLFPGGDHLAEALAPDAPILMPMRAEGAGEPRVTLSARVLDAALSKHIVVMGEEKRAALKAAERLTRFEAPIRAVWSDATVHWAA